MAPLTKETLETLAFIRYMVGMAQEQAEKPDPFCVTAILTLHDAVELFLIQAQEQPGVTNVPGGDPALLAKFQMMLANGDHLTHKDTIAKLLKFRVPFKHYATFLPQKEVQSILVLVMQFLVENTPRAFGIDFEAISLLDLVHDDLAKEHLELAEKHHQANNHTDAFAELSIAFQVLMDSFNSIRDLPLKHNPSRFSSGIDVTYSYRRRVGSGEGLGDGAILGAITDQIDDVYKEVDAMQTVLALLALKLDYARYLKFQSLIPYAMGYISTGTARGTDYTVWTERFTPQPDRYQYCINFIIELAIAVENLHASV